MIRVLLTFVFLAAFSSVANATANQRSCSTSVPLSMTINYGDDVGQNCKLTLVGQIALFMFQGNTGDEITISLDSSWGNGPCADLYDPTNKQVKTSCGYDLYGGSGAYNAWYTATLAMTGQYTIRVHDSSNTHRTARPSMVRQSMIGLFLERLARMWSCRFSPRMVTALASP